MDIKQSTEYNTIIQGVFAMLFQDGRKERNH